MPRFVPPRRTGLSTAEIKAGLPVSGLTWTAIGDNSNWLLGSGHMCVPAYAPNVSLAAGTSETFRFRVPTTTACIERDWYFGFTGILAATSYPTVRSPAGSGSYSTIFASEGGMATPYRLREAVASPVGIVREIGFDVLPVTDAAKLVMVQCQEVPRRILTAAEFGTELSDVEPGDPVLEGIAQGAAASSRSPSLGRRSLVQWAVPAKTTYAVSTSSSTFQDLWTLPQPVLTRRLGGQDEANITVEVYAWVTGGGAGEVRVTTSDSANTSSAVAVANTSPAWKVCTVDANAEALSQSDGLAVANTHDELQVQYRATSGTIYVTGVSAYET